MQKTLAALALTAALACARLSAADMAPPYLFCGAGDNLYNVAVEPVDSPAAIDALLDYTSSTYGVKRLYWRVIGEFADHLKVGRVQSPASYDWTRWLNYLGKQFDPDATAARLAHARGMEAFCYAGLFEFGLQPDAYAGYRFEFIPRVQHPEWVPTDRWGERQETGALSFAIPESRKFMVDYFTNLMEKDGYDGINFYTYVENFGIHYEHEFGFEEAVVARFNERYPDVDLRTAKLTDEQAEYWYECRGHFVTLFLKDLGAALHAKGKKLSMILDADEPKYNQPWWGMPIRGSGKIRMEYEKWISEGIVDEIWVQLAETEAQRRTLDMLLPLVQGTPVKLTVRAVNPFDAGWEKYRAAGVSPIAVITWARNGVEAYTKEPLTAASLASTDWKVRAQALRAVGKGDIAVPPERLLAMRNDTHVLVRRALYAALATTAKKGHPELVPVIEAGLKDGESCVRIAATLALKTANRPESADALFEAVAAHPEEFQLKITAWDALKEIGSAAQARMEARLSHPVRPVRELAAAGLRKLVIHNLVDQTQADAICGRLQAMLMNPQEDTLLRLLLVEQTIGMRANISKEQQGRLIDDVTTLVEDGSNWEVQLKAAAYGQHLSPLMAYPQRLRMKNALVSLFMAYGTGCARPDAAYGWRDVGNSLVAQGSQAAVEELLAKREDPFVAWYAYKVLYDRQGMNPESRKTKGFNIIDEATAVENHRKYAPPFPGNRTW